ncbi:LLM class flavin-dependent oxidoreductase [Iamia sp. SCSIO 61187]|uniref:LLM class flavin-dependent oxidoreductase n=1 Tax=Iamia sp. SCSIO 61187 TaxID=2722752 RepID=UPI001C63382D|nr:LLM class flavin-dependent oxidoreductase [Iamia sp. SCSIO 61187]QYG94858.1 LLM class flavin-dependent oxidoreductase [Iamia sp. SCSIO 61187]
MRFSHWISTAHPTDEVLTRGRHAEATGWDGLWVADHFMANQDGPSDEPMHECFSLLAALAATVPRVRLGSLVAGNTYRHPAVLAKQATTIDHISGGRMVLGIGAGWQVNEHEAYGIPLGTVKERLAWFEEACQVITGLRDQARITVAGDRYQLTDAPLSPKPVGPLPLLVGSSGQTVMARIVATHAQEWNTWSTPEQWVEKRAGYDRALEEAGRDPATLHRSTQALVLVGPDGAAKAEELRAVRPAIGGTAEQLVDTIGRWAEAGLDELIVPDFTLGPLDRATDALDLLITEVAPAFR